MNVWRGEERRGEENAYGGKDLCRGEGRGSFSMMMILGIEWDCSTILGADWLGFQPLGVHGVSKSSGCFHGLQAIFLYKHCTA